MTLALLATVVVLFVLVVLAVTLYNRLVALREGVKAQWAQIDVLLKRRADLVPNLVETVKGYAKHEATTLENVVNARARATSTGERVVAENQLTGALGRLLAVGEAYPELKANAGFQQLQGELSSTEGGIAAQRQAYNAQVQRYNTSIKSFPANLVAAPLGFTEQPMLETPDPVERAAPKVQF